MGSTGGTSGTSFTIMGFGGGLAFPGGGLRGGSFGTDTSAEYGFKPPDAGASISSASPSSITPPRGG